MFRTNLTILRIGVLACAGVCLGQKAASRDPAVPGLAAVATNADVSYCFARVRGLDPGRQPASYIDLQLRVQVSYRNAGARPLILPLEHEMTIYYGLKPEGMSAFRDNVDLFEPAVKPMKELPAQVSRENPASPGNEFFAVIPPRGEMAPPLWEEIALPVNRTGFFKKYPDLRDHRVYIKLQFVHRELSPALKTDLSGQWAAFGALWTGTLTTNTFVVDVPAIPPAAAVCVDPRPAHPASSRDQPVQSGK